MYLTFSYNKLAISMILSMILSIILSMMLSMILSMIMRFFRQTAAATMLAQISADSLKKTSSYQNLIVL